MSYSTMSRVCVCVRACVRACVCVCRRCEEKDTKSVNTMCAEEDVKKKIRNLLTQCRRGDPGWEEGGG